VLPEVTFNPLNTIVSVERFVEQIDILNANYHIIPLRDAITKYQAKEENGKEYVVLTFDDGYWDNYEFVFKILKSKGLSATFFLPTDYISCNKTVWDWEILRMLCLGKEINRVTIDGEDFERRTNESRLSFCVRAIVRLKAAKIEIIEETIDHLKSQIDEAQCSFSAKDVCMTWEQVGTMSRHGMEIGSHSMSHRSLASIPAQEAFHEITKGREVIENNIEDKCLHFAFPFGARQDYNEELIDGVNAAGFRTCLLNIHGYNRLPAEDSKLLSFKRIIMTESFEVEYLLG
jgi:peptidoglycan/xylan/chitin deacetylase (PgdA/CDA1 family)